MVFQKVRDVLHNHVLPKAKIEEFYTLDIEKLVEIFRDKALGN